MPSITMYTVPVRGMTPVYSYQPSVLTAGVWVMLRRAWKSTVPPTVSGVLLAHTLTPSFCLLL